MTDQEPTDLVVLIKIIDYLSQRRNAHQNDPIDRAAIMHIVNNLAPGAQFGLTFRSETTSIEETHVGDNYEVSGQAAAVGREARAENTTMNQIRTGSNADLSVLARELDTLRNGMRAEAKTVADDQATVEIGLAVAAAERGDGDEVQSRLKNAGKWALGVATSIGTGVAAGAIRSALGL
jgi:hypothetical protein